MTDNNNDPNKIITPFTDCQGTCKTPIGCTCGASEDFDESEEQIVTVGKQIKKVGVEEVVEQDEVVVEKGGCACHSKRRKNGSVPCCLGANKLEVYNWLENYPDILAESKMVEVQFKNTRKGYYVNSNNLDINKGDIVAVEATPGHDIGEVTLTGKLVELQMKKMNFRGEIKRVYRKVKPADMEKYHQAKGKEHKTMLRAREIAEELNLDMKISDVEYQGDGNKAIFYYIADGRVDFRQLIKHYASEFRIKIEMKQIGARQEAGRVGGIGPCGRELCCSSSMSNFVSVSTQAARLQDIPLNPQKLAGQCGKLKCCLNFEVDTYIEAQRGLPSRDVVLETKDSSYFHLKTDILSGMISYSTDKSFAVNVVTVPRNRVFDVIKQNRKGDKPLSLIEHENDNAGKKQTMDLLEEESITRFDTANNSKPDGGEGRLRKSKKKKKNNSQPAGQNGQERKEASGQGNNNKKEVKTVNNSERKVSPNPQGDNGSSQQGKSADRNNRRRNNRGRNNRGGGQPPKVEGQNPPAQDGRERKNIRNKNNEAGSQE